jgi:formylglycine-generating enzyme required for sulfatase activity
MGGAVKIKVYIVSILIVCAVIAGFCLEATAQNKVVVIPLMGSVGNATASDVLKGKTFSSTAGEGFTGTLEIRGGSTIYTNPIGMKFSLIPAGSFVMCSPNGSGDGYGTPPRLPDWPAEGGRQSVERQHVVTLTQAFYMQTTEVTQGQWVQVMGSNPSHFTSCGSDCPVEMVSWTDAQSFIDTLNVSEGRTNCNTTPNTCYFLSTESQWEYAARGGTVSAFYNGAITNTDNDCDVDPKLDAIGWYCGNADNTTHPVAQKEPNNWGLYDMSGNVWEWCNDLYGTYPNGPLVDPTGSGTGSSRVRRGGGLDYGARYARSAYRSFGVPTNRYNSLGFRLALPPGQ